MGLADCVRLPFRIRTSTRCWSSGAERLEMYPFIFTPTIQRPDGCIKFWQGETFELLEGVSLIRGGGHFPGGTMLHWAAGAEGKGVVCSADIATVNLDLQVLHVHAQLSEQYPPVRKSRPCHRGGAEASSVRSGLQPPLRTGPPFGRRADLAGVRGALQCADRWRL